MRPWPSLTNGLGARWESGKDVQFKVIHTTEEMRILEINLILIKNTGLIIWLLWESIPYWFRGGKGGGLKMYFTVFFWGASVVSERSTRQRCVPHTDQCVDNLDQTHVDKRLNRNMWGYGKVQREGINQTIMCFVIPTSVHTFQSLSVMSARLGKERRPASGKLVKLLNLLRFCYRKVFHRWHKCSTSKLDELDGITIIVFQLLLYAHIN